MPLVRRAITDSERQAYLRRSQGPCFICEMLAGNPEYRHHIIYQDALSVAFLNKYPPLYGYVLVAPLQHREQATADFNLDEYLQIQSLIYRLSEAIRRTVPTERIYLLSLGSQQGNRHVHWHLAPLPPGVPYEQQQFSALDGSAGLLELDDAEMADLARRIRHELNPML